jgi:hypothetical protein
MNFAASLPSFRQNPSIVDPQTNNSDQKQAFLVFPALAPWIVPALITGIGVTSAWIGYNVKQLYDKNPQAFSHLFSQEIGKRDPNLAKKIPQLTQQQIEKLPDNQKQIIRLSLEAAGQQSLKVASQPPQATKVVNPYRAATIDGNPDCRDNLQNYRDLIERGSIDREAAKNILQTMRDLRNESTCHVGQKQLLDSFIEKIRNLFPSLR